MTVIQPHVTHTKQFKHCNAKLKITNISTSRFGQVLHSGSLLQDRTIWQLSRVFTQLLRMLLWEEGVWEETKSHEHVSRGITVDTTNSVFKNHVYIWELQVCQRIYSFNSYSSLYACLMQFSELRNLSNNQFWISFNNLRKHT